MRKYWPHIISFIVLTFFQVTILNKVQFFDFANPYIYLLFILLLPIHINRSLLILLGFVSGSVIDIFSNSMGVQAAATTLIAFLRPFVITGISTKLDLESKHIPSVNEMKWTWFILYAVILVFIHHLFLYVMESLRHINIIHLFYKTTVNSIITLLMIFIVVLLFKNNRKI